MSLAPHTKKLRLGIPWWSSGKGASQVVLVVKNLLPMQETWDTGSVPGSERSPGRGHGSPLQYSCQENPSHGQRSLAGYSPWGCRVRHNWNDLAHRHASGKGWHFHYHRPRFDPWLRNLRSSKLSSIAKREKSRGPNWALGCKRLEEEEWKQKSSHENYTMTDGPGFLLPQRY